jgi:hypothetical protein
MTFFDFADAGGDKTGGGLGARRTGSLSTPTFARSAVTAFGCAGALSGRALF